MTFKITSLSALAAIVVAGSALAAPVNGTGDLQNGVVFGSGNANGAFTGVNAFGVELALRGKLRYDLAGAPQNVFNYDGIDTYTFDPADSNAPANRSIFNFEFSVDVTGTGNDLATSGWDFLLGVDTDPSAGTDYFAGAFSPLLYSDNAGGAAVAQNSQNLGFGYTVDPQAEGVYSLFLSGTNGTESLRTDIDIVVGSPSAVPLPAGLPLLLAGLGGLAFLRKRKAG